MQSNGYGDRQGQGNLIDAMKAFIEALHPDLRGAFRPELPGVVTAVHDDDEAAEYYTVDVVIIGAGPEDENGNRGDLSLPNVPVDAVWAHDGYGVWALPEVNAEVNVGFHNWDVTRPHVTGAAYRENRAPDGFTAGTFAIRGKHGQKIELKPGSNEIVITAGSMKVIRTRTGQEHTAGDQAEDIGGDLRVTVHGTDERMVRRQKVAVAEDSEQRYGSLIQVVSEDAAIAVLGSLRQDVGGSLSQTVAGGGDAAYAMNRRIMVGGGYEMIVANTPGISPGRAWYVLANNGIAALDAYGPLAGIRIGADPFLAPSILGITIGSGASGPIYLNSSGAFQPAVLGQTLVNVLTTLFTAMLGPMQTGNLGAPTAPLASFTAQIVALQSQLAALLAPRVFIGQT